MNLPRTNITVGFLAVAVPLTPCRKTRPNINFKTGLKLNNAFPPKQHKKWFYNPSVIKIITLFAAASTVDPMVGKQFGSNITPVKKNPNNSHKFFFHKWTKKVQILSAFST